MKRLFVIALALSSCAKNHSTPTPTQVEPVSHSESQSVRDAIRYGNGISPDEVIAAVEPQNCSDFVSKLPGFTAGTLSVPEDWDNPETSPKIEVFYYWRKAQGEAVRRPPVVFFNGGPASDSHGSATLLSSLAFTSDSSFVFLDQRGTGCSTSFPAGETVKNATRLMNWGSKGIVNDAEAVRKHLFGDRKWRIYGQSYGGFIVHRYTEIHPEGIDRAIAHGASIMKDPLAWSAERIRSQQRVGSTYFAKYSGDQEIIQETRAGISNEQCWKHGTDSICGPNVLDSLTMMLGFHDNWPNLHKWIQALKAKDGVLNKKTLDNVVRTFVFGEYGAGGLGGDVISKMEIVPGYDDRANCTGALEILKADGEDPDSYPINECRLLMSYQKPNFELMKDVTAKPISIDRIAAHLSHGGPSFFLFSGQQDVFVPFATFDEEVKDLGSLIHYESFPNSGHEGFYTENDVIRAVTEANAPADPSKELASLARVDLDP
jgi:pimeloyl-ACP methyl ester carboxylesterase